MTKSLSLRTARTMYANDAIVFVNYELLLLLATDNSFTDAKWPLLLAEETRDSPRNVSTIVVEATRKFCVSSRFDVGWERTTHDPLVTKALP